MSSHINQRLKMHHHTWLPYGTSIPLIRFILLCLLATFDVNAAGSSHQNIIAPSSQPEAYFNGSAYLRLQTIISLKRQTGLSFRTCAGGNLFSQQQADESMELLVNSEGLLFYAKSGGKKYESKIGGSFLDNEWHTVHLYRRLGNLTLEVDGGRQRKLIANATYNHELLYTLDTFNEGSTVLLIGKQFNGCLLDGPSLVFDSSIISSSHNVRFGKCVLPEGSCSELDSYLSIVDYCINEPCMRQGTCVSSATGYNCSCLPRYTGKNCEIDSGSPCEKSVCRNGASCIEDAFGDYKCICVPLFTGYHCEFQVVASHQCNSPSSAASCQNGAYCVTGAISTATGASSGISGQDNNSGLTSHEVGGTDAAVSSDQRLTSFCLCVSGYTGTFCEINLDECKNTPCKHGAQCVDGVNNFTCVCEHTGYTGRLCEININECLHNPCQNNGVCFDHYGGYLCHCTPGYGGTNCEYALDECSSQPCLNGGRCISISDSDGSPFDNSIKASGYKCECLAGFGGVHCEIEERQTLQCDQSSCPYYAECSDSAAGPPGCVCKPEYPGKYPNCSLPTAEGACTPNLCKNGGICTPWKGTFVCTCLPNFTGKFCQTRIENQNYCASMPCQNGGQCLEQPVNTNNGNGFLCNCTDQWMGALCERPYDACELRPCHNNATCISSLNRHDFTCNCLPGFEGALCEINHDDCIAVECPPGKVCIDLVNSYECRCTNGATDDNCSAETVDACLKQPCAKGSTCYFDRTTRQYSCVCAPGYTGRNCNVDINECELPSAVALCNSGICVNKEGGFQCYCQPGFTGDRCDVDFDECLSMPCRNNASCLNKVNNYECVCPAGYMGKDCEVDINECEPMPCRIGSTCLDGINEYTCVCQAGLTGRTCETNIDDCDPSPCLHDSTCIDGLNTYTCNCTNTGYMGLHCELNIDDCISQPCQHGAICVDDVKDYHCDCYPGYTGKNCEKDINECEDHPCKHSGVCLERSNVTLYHLYNQTLVINDRQINLPASFARPFDYKDAAGYECVCVPGVIGRNCEFNINECESSPCFQGTCIDRIGGYSCECDEGYEGEHCDIDIDECAKYTPCIHGRCIDKRAAYYCDCDASYGGQNCSVPLIGCEGSPCLNAGTCHPYLVHETIHRFNCSCATGFHGPVCDQVTTMSFTGNSTVLVNTKRDEGYDIQFRFRTTLADGLLALGKGSTYYILELSQGRLNLHSSLLNKWEGVLAGTGLNNSQWQRVFVAINATHLVLSANYEQSIFPIWFNDNINGSSYTSFAETYIGGTPANLRKLTHGLPAFVGCIEDVIINNEWLVPEEHHSDKASTSFHGVEVGCKREPQCNPNPCHSGGHCTDMWRDFKCTCGRPYLGHTCQYNYTAATFGYEDIADSLVTVRVADRARRAVRTIVDLSMFIRTRQNRGQIFYLGSSLGAINSTEETFIAAQLEGGELHVRILFNGTHEAYTVGGQKLDNGYNHLIQVIRNITLVQVKLNGTEYFRKTISATGALDAQVLFLGGQPQLRPVRQATIASSMQAGAGETLRIDIIPPTTSTTSRATLPLSNVHFKGIIQDVQISNGSSIMVVEFFPLQAPDVDVPMSFGTVAFDRSTVLEGVRSDNSCKVNPCHNGECQNTWNDYVCLCPRGYKGKDCTELEFCELEKCPRGSKCNNLEDGYECLSNASFDGKSRPLRYHYVFEKFAINSGGEAVGESTLSMLTPLEAPPTASSRHLDRLELTYRTRSWGKVWSAIHKKDYFIIFIYYNEVIVEWRLGAGGMVENRRFRREPFDGQWLTLLFYYKDGVGLIGGFKDQVIDETPSFEAADFDVIAFEQMIRTGSILVGGGHETIHFDYRSIIGSSEANNASFGGGVDSTTLTMAAAQRNIDVFNNNNLLYESYSVDVPSVKIDQNKESDLFKGCLGEIRIGGLLMPYFTIDKLYPKNHYLNEYFELVDSEGDEAIESPAIGCVLCYDEDCLNSGFCINHFESYKCNCTEGYTADDCSIDINECENNLCQNNSTCKDLIAKYECDCQPGYEGVNCEIDINECLSNPCKHGGTCIDLVGAFKCECPEDFVGKQCEAPLLITCDNRPCREGATCQTGSNPVTGNNFTCVCTEGMEGPLCDMPFCASEQCVHGFCNSSELVPFCQCNNGFEGRLCEINIDDCIQTGTHSSPCQHGGICIDGIGRYDCNCTNTGYNGLLCELDIDECELFNPCGQDGVCTNFYGGYNCSCTNRLMCGNQCALLDPCADPYDNQTIIVSDNLTSSSTARSHGPCANGGICISLCTDVADYACQCRESYTGKNCTENKVIASRSDDAFNVLFVAVPISLLVLITMLIGMVMVVNMARSKRATRGTYSPSAQEFCNPRVELDHVLKPPPEERLI